MKSVDRDYSDIIDLLRNADLGYAFKKRRLKFIRYASTSVEIRTLRDNFHDLWITDGGRLHLKDASVSKKALEILRGLFGESDRAQAILDIDRAMAAIDRARFRDFLDEHIASANARSNLLAIMFDREESVVKLVRRQVPYLERYIPTMKKFDIESISSLILDEADVESLADIASRIGDIERNFSNDIGLYGRFIRDFKNLYRGPALIDIVGYGEISTVMRLKKTVWENDERDIIKDESRWLWKKMPPFPGMTDVESYENLYNEYRRLLVNDVGIPVPRQTTRHFKHGDCYIVYAGQERLDERRVCNVLIKSLDRNSAITVLVKILRKLHDVHRFNTTNTRCRIGIDAQLSNWVVMSRHDSLDHIYPEDSLAFIDTSSPMIRIEGKEQVNTEIFIKSAASFLRPVIRTFFLQEVLDRYYDMRSVMIDIIANLYKEKRTDLIDDYIEKTNEFIRSTGISERNLTRKEIDKYYSGDVLIWRFYQASRKIDRFITEKILRQKYVFRIPGRIER